MCWIMFCACHIFFLLTVRPLQLTTNGRGSSRMEGILMIIPLSRSPTIGIWVGLTIERQAKEK
jgi:hypothetical protein